jgi:hypothetical protein
MTDTSETRIQNALNVLGDTNLDMISQEIVEKAEEKVEIVEKAEEKPAEKIEEKVEDRSEYYAKLVEKDKEIRKLKSQLKGTDYKSLAKENPLKVLEELGIPMDRVLDAWVGGEKVEEPVNEIVELKKELDLIKKEREQTKLQAAYENEISTIKDIVGKDSDKWELIKTTNNYELVLSTAQAYYNENGEVPAYGDVLDYVEKSLEEQYGPMIEKLLETKKFKGKSKKADDVITEMKKSPLPGPTLSNQHSSESATPKGYTEQERFQRALAVLENDGD